MVFIKFYNMNRGKKFPNVAFKLKQTQRFFTLQQVKTILQSQFTNVQFSFLLFFQSMYCLFKKKCSFFLSFFFISCVQKCSSSFFFLFSFCLFFSHCPVAFFFLLVFFSVFIFFHFFIHNTLLIQCLFFFQTLYLPLSVLTLIL